MTEHSFSEIVISVQLERVCFLTCASDKKTPRVLRNGGSSSTVASAVCHPLRVARECVSVLLKACSAALVGLC